MFMNAREQYQEEQNYEKIWNRGKNNQTPLC